MALAYDTGYYGSLKSLSGKPSKPGYGLQVLTYGQAGAGTARIAGNPNRVWLVIQNIDTNEIWMNFGDALPVVNASIRIPAGGIIQIDDSLRWIGTLTFASFITTVSISFAEASLAGV